MVVGMSEIEVNQDSTLWLTIFASNKILIFTIDVSQECFTKVMIIGVVVDSKVLIRRECFLLTL